MNVANLMVTLAQRVANAPKNDLPDPGLKILCYPLEVRQTTGGEFVTHAPPNPIILHPNVARHWDNPSNGSAKASIGIRLAYFSAATPALAEYIRENRSGRRLLFTVDRNEIQWAGKVRPSRFAVHRRRCRLKVARMMFAFIRFWDDNKLPQWIVGAASIVAAVTSAANCMGV